MSRASRYQRHDRFYQKAKRDEFAARSVYKLEELDQRYGLIQKGQVVVDLGCAPGSWLQYLGERVGRKGGVVGYDLVEVELVLGPRGVARVADVLKLTPEQILDDVAELMSEPPRPPDAAATGSDSESRGPAKRPRVDALVSDMAPKLTGIRDADQARSVHMVAHALELAVALLPKEKGVFVAKLFQGRDTDELVASVKRAFREVKLLKPNATREGSREVFVLGRILRADRGPEGPRVEALPTLP